jgi:hypothetical protein
MKHSSIARRGAAVLTAVALTLGASALLAPAADAKAKKPLKGNLSGTVALACNVPAFGADFDYEAELKLTGKRAKKSVKKVTLKATMNDLPPVAPVAITDAEMKATLVLKTGSTTAKLSGAKTVSAAASSPVPMPPVSGSTNNKKNSLAVSVVSLDMDMMGIEITCVPAESGALGTLKLK